MEMNKLNRIKRCCIIEEGMFSKSYMNFPRDCPFQEAEFFRFCSQMMEIQ